MTARKVPTRKPGVYRQVISRVFFDAYLEGTVRVDFSREQVSATALELGLTVRNLGDLIYTFRFRQSLPLDIRQKAPAGHHWIIRLRGPARYSFDAVAQPHIVPSYHRLQIRIPDATPGVISRYALSDEQALLAILRYNRLVDVFTGVTCYSLQNHLRTQIPDVGQTETDEVYLGVDKHGAHYVFPVQAKGGRDKIGIVQIDQDIALCRYKFPHLVCRPIAAQFLGDEVIALFLFSHDADGTASLVDERHYRLVGKDQLTDEELEFYRNNSLGPILD